MLTVEAHNESLWLVLDGDLLARFTTPDAAERWKVAHARSMAFAREVGRSGLG